VVELHRRIARSLAELGVAEVEVAWVLGSGLGAVADRLAAPRSIPFSEVDGMPVGKVPGHAGRFVIGTVAGTRVLVQQGRVHRYEGWSDEEVCGSVRALAELGCRALVLTNAAGGLRPGWPLPSLMIVTDHIDLQGGAGLRGAGGPRAVSRRPPYDPEFGTALLRASAESGETLASGVYAGVLGPSYETPAEVAMLAWMGADAVGMSTVREASAARAVGMRVAAVSCVTNRAAGLAGEPLSHRDVLRAGELASEGLGSLLVRASPAIARLGA
jgi:purine-nucleoside phosphorylase